MTPKLKAEVSQLRKEAAKKRKLLEQKSNQQEERDKEPVNDCHGDQFGRSGAEGTRGKKQKTNGSG